MTKLQSALLATTTFALGAVAVSALHAQNNAPYYQVAGINVTDQAGYEASGVGKVREEQMANGGITVAGGYNKAHAFTGNAPANRYLIIRYPSKAAAEKAFWNGKRVRNGGIARVTSTLPSVPLVSRVSKQSSAACCFCRE